MAERNPPLAPGWAESLGRELATESKEHAALRRQGKAPLRRSWSENYAAGVRGGERGHSSLRLDRALERIDPAEGDGEDQP
jgi:hypothetical protein